MSRVREIRDNLIGTEDPDDLMMEIISVLNEGGKVPEATEHDVDADGSCAIHGGHCSS